MNRTLVFAAAAATVVVAAPAFAQAGSPRDYVAAAGASDLYERQSSQLVLTTTRNPAVRRFAQMMVTQHTQSSAKVMAAAHRDRVPAPPPHLNRDQARMIAELRAQRGPARDATYISQQRMAHDQALALHQSYATQGRTPALRSAASMIVPVVRHHIEMLRNM